MTKPLVFMMGRSPVFLPTDRRYARNHMWVAGDESACRVGFSAYAVRLLGDVHHVEWAVEPGATVESGQQIGFIEGSKATSDLYVPLAGEIQEINRQVEANPTRINSNPYDSGWLLVICADDMPLLTPEQYVEHLEASWPLAQRLLKGQAGSRKRGTQ